MTETKRDYRAERIAFLKGLDWTGPAADLYDDVLDYLTEEDAAKRADPAYAALLEEHFRTGEYRDIFPTFEDLAEAADAIVSRRLK